MAWPLTRACVRPSVKAIMLGAVSLCGLVIAALCAILALILTAQVALGRGVQSRGRTAGPGPVVPLLVASFAFLILAAAAAAVDAKVARATSDAPGLWTA